MCAGVRVRVRVCVWVCVFVAHDIHSPESVNGYEVGRGRYIPPEIAWYAPRTFNSNQSP